MAARQADWRDVFCGRVAQLRDLELAYQDLVEGRGPRLVVLLGDRGMDKTRLVQELYRLLTDVTVVPFITPDPGPAFLRARCSANMATGCSPASAVRCAANARSGCAARRLNTQVAGAATVQINSSKMQLSSTAPSPIARQGLDYFCAVELCTGSWPSPSSKACVATLTCTSPGLAD
jgi:hypothetical protein